VNFIDPTGHYPQSCDQDHIAIGYLNGQSGGGCIPEAPIPSMTAVFSLTSEAHALAAARMAMTKRDEDIAFQGFVAASGFGPAAEAFNEIASMEEEFDALIPMFNQVLGMCLYEDLCDSIIISGDTLEGDPTKFTNIVVTIFTLTTSQGGDYEYYEVIKTVKLEGTYSVEAAELITNFAASQSQ